MTYPRMLGIVAVAFGLLAAQQAPDDPVMRIRAQRAQAGGDQDLPPVPRSVMEPPPLPPPEVHVKDTRGYRAKRGKKGKVTVVKKGVSKGNKVRRPKKSALVKK
jgi:hypothetical protein